jgi:long-subunit acyl-CoA synthetase (AMP-forming)
MAGHVSVPIYPDLTATSVAQLLEHSGAALVFVGKLDDWSAMREGVRAGLPTVSLPLCPAGAQLDFSWGDLQAWTPVRDNPYGQPGQLATIIYTPGTTGMPKGVMHSFATLGFAATHGASVFGLGEKDRLFSCLSLCHVFERMFVELASLYGGQTVFFAQGLGNFLDDMKRARPTALFTVPQIWIRFRVCVLRKIPASRLDFLLDLPLIGKLVGHKVLKGMGLDALKIALSGAAPVSEAVLRWYKRLGLDMRQVYGLTETCGYSHICRARERKSGWVGQPCPHVEVRIAADGEVQVRSGANMLGYFKDPQQTAQTLTPDGFLRTGDTGEQDEEGYLRLTGRLTRCP